MNEYIHPYPIQRGFEKVAHLFRILNEDGIRGYIAGSYAAWMSEPRECWKPNDVDIFTTSNDAFYSLSARLGRENYILLSEGEIVHGFTHRFTPQAIQLIKPNPSWSNFPHDILDSFDLTVGMAALIDETTVLAHPDAGTLHSKILRINEPIRTLKRVMKYHLRGVRFEDFELIKLFAAWDQMTEAQKLTATALHQSSGSIQIAEYEFDFDDFFFEE